MIRIQVSLTNEQYQALKAAAETSGLGTSALLRRLVTDGLAVTKPAAPAAAAVPEEPEGTKPRRPPARRRREG